MTNIKLEDAKTVAESDLNWSKINNKIVLVTGATGFIGSCIIRALLYRNMFYKSNIKIVAMIRSIKKAESIFADIPHKDLKYIVGDVREGVPNFSGNIDYIIHCASNAGPREYAADPVGTMLTNFNGTINMLNFAKRYNCKKFLYVSTLEIYGRTDGKTVSESDYGVLDSTNIRTCYPISKKTCETAAICYADQYGLNVSIGRLSYIFGAGMNKDDSKVVAILAKAAANGEEMILKSKGTQNRSYTYISDAVTGLLTILLEGENKEVYNIASSSCITTIANIGATLYALYANKGAILKFDIDESQKGSIDIIRDAVISNDKLKSLGWKETVDLKNGLIRMVKYYEEG